MSSPRLVGGRYELGELLGYGGMAEVHKGRDVRLGRDVAVKVLRADLARDPSFQARFRREAQAAAGLNHPSIVAVYDTGEDPDPTGRSDQVSPYIVMEFVEGRTLRDVLKSEGKLPARRAMEITAEICAALDFSHRAGIVHRDIKPGNVMITENGAVKVMDFGIARAMADNAATVTATAAVIGTAQYLSPEQARGESVDARSDVYSVGCLLYELLTGNPPFTGDSPVAVAFQHVRESARIPSSIDPSIPRELDSIVMKALAKNPLNRYQTAGEMRGDLMRAIGGQRVEAESVMTEDERTQLIARPVTGGAVVSTRGGAVAQAARPGILTPTYEAEDDTKRGRGALIWSFVAVCLVIVIAGAAWFVINRDTKPKVQMVPVADIVGLTPQSAQAQLRRLGLAYDTNPEQVHGPCTTGTGQVVALPVVNTICTQGTKANTEVAAGTTITYTIYAGPQKVAVPNVNNESLASARTDLNKVGLGIAAVKQVDSFEAAGTVLDQDPTGGNMVDPGTSITLSVSKGTRALPDVTGMTYEQARVALGKAGWNSVTSTKAQVVSPFKAGQVMSMSPTQGAAAAQSQKITLTVGTPAPVCATSTPPAVTSSVPTTVPASPTPGVTPTPGVPTQSTVPTTVPTTIQPSPTVVCTTPAG